jgi:hypothetical protein
MDFSWVLEPATLVGFLTLLVLEVVLGIDNLVFVAILANKVKPQIPRQSPHHRFVFGSGDTHHHVGSMAYIMTLDHAAVLRG